MSKTLGILVDMFVDVDMFHNKFGFYQYMDINELPESLVQFRKDFLIEEAKETKDCLIKKDQAGALDGLCDLAFVALGTLHLMGVEPQRVKFVEADYSLAEIFNMATGEFDLGQGATQYLIDITAACRTIALTANWDFDTAWERVVRANMLKERAEPKDERSKRNSEWDIVKPIGWTPPFMDDLV